MEDRSATILLLENIYFHDKNSVPALHRDIFNSLKCVCHLQGESAASSSDTVFIFPKEEEGKKNPLDLHSWMLCSSIITRPTTYHRRLGTKLMKILPDNDHPLSVVLHNVVIPRSGGMRLPYSSTNRQPSSFIPQCIKFHNLTFKR